MSSVIEGLDCPCGFSGDNCTEATSVLVLDANFVNETCSPDGFESCFIGEEEIGCVCKCGWEGELCETRLVPLNMNYIIIGVLSVVIFLFSIAVVCLRNHCLRKADKPTHLPYDLEDFSTSHFRCISPRFILIYRVFMFLSFLGILAYEVSEGTPIVFAEFSLWLWLMFGLYSLFGCILSVKHLRDGESGSLTFLHILLLEVTLSSSIFLTITTWSLLFPSSSPLVDDSLQTLDTDFTVYVYYGVNICLLVADFMISKVYVQFYHVIYVVCWGTLYLLFHSGYMLVEQLQGADHCPVYQLLDLSEQLFGVSFITSLVLLAVSFLITFFISVLKKCCMRAKKDEDVKAVDNRESKFYTFRPSIDY